MPPASAEDRLSNLTTKLDPLLKATLRLRNLAKEINDFKLTTPGSIGDRDPKLNTAPPAGATESDFDAWQAQCKTRWRKESDHKASWQVFDKQVATLENEFELCLGALRQATQLEAPNVPLDHVVGLRQSTRLSEGFDSDVYGNTQRGDGTQTAELMNIDQSASENTTLPQLQRTITFEEVYQNGKAKSKHMIVPFSLDDGLKGYCIVVCKFEGCNKCFGKDPLAGARSHLPQMHGFRDATNDNILRHIATQVIDCDEKRVVDNNNAFKIWFNSSEQVEARRALKNEQRQRGKEMQATEAQKQSTRKRSQLDWSTPEESMSEPEETDLRKKRRSRLTRPAVVRDLSPNAEFFEKLPRPLNSSNASRRRQERFKQVDFNNVKVGELYFYEPKMGAKCWAAIIAPLFEQGLSRQRAEVLQTGKNLDEFVRRCYEGELERIPDSIDYDPRERTVRGWKAGYRDGEAGVPDRSYLAILIDGPGYPTDSHFAWVKAQDGFGDEIGAKNVTLIDTGTGEDKGVAEYLAKMKEAKEVDDQEALEVARQHRPNEALSERYEQEAWRQTAEKHEQWKQYRTGKTPSATELDLSGHIPREQRQHASVSLRKPPPQTATEQADEMRSLRDCLHESSRSNIYSEAAKMAEAGLGRMQPKPILARSSVTAKDISPHQFPSWKNVNHSRLSTGQSISRVAPVATMHPSNQDDIDSSEGEGSDSIPP